MRARWKPGSLLAARARTQLSAVAITVFGFQVSTLTH
jgi:hypothetical protein